MRTTMDPAPCGDVGSDLLRVCIDTRPLFSGHRQRGIGTYVNSLVTQIEQLHQRDRMLATISFTYLQPARASKGTWTPDVRVVARPGAAIATSSSSQRQHFDQASLATALDQIPCDLYHATSLEGIALSRAYKTVVTLYDLIPLRMGDWSAHARHPLSHLAYLKRLRLLTQAHHVIAISQATKADACRLLGLTEERMSVIPLAHDPLRGHLPSEGERAAARTGLKLREPYFLAVASFDRHKNLARVVEAFAAFREGAAGDGAGGDYRLYLVGTWMGRGARRIRDVIRQLRLNDVVRHLPWVPVEHLPALYHGATALVFPSLLEGFGLPVLEAMASGTTVITSNCSALPEVGGDAALYVSPENVVEIAGAMRMVATHPELRAELIARGCERSRQFDWERTTRKTIEVYQRVATGKDGSHPTA